MRLRTSVRWTFIVAGLLVLGGIASTGQASTALWSKKLEEPINWQKVTDVGTLLVGTDEGIYSFDPATGEPIWARDDLKKIPSYYAVDLQGTPFLLVAENEGKIKLKTRVYALEILTGKTVWETEPIEGLTVGYIAVPEKGFLIGMTIPAAAAKSKIDMLALDIATGKTLWTSMLDKKVDLYPSETTGKLFQRFDVSGHMPIVYDEDAFYCTFAGLHRYSLADGKLIWGVPYDVTAKAIKRGNAQIVIDGDVIYTSARGQLRAIDKNTGEIKWTSKDFGGAIAEMQLKDDVIYGRMGGSLYDWQRKQWVLMKPLGVVAVNKATGEETWRFTGAKASITNMAIFEDLDTILIADEKYLIGLDTNATGKVKETFEVKLEFKDKIGGADVAAGAMRVLGGLGGGGKGGGGDRKDPPVAISQRADGSAVVRAKRHILAFDPAKKEILWSLEYGAPGGSTWAKIAMGVLSALSYAESTRMAYSTSSGSATNTWANNQRFESMDNYANLLQKRFSASAETDNYAYILTKVPEPDGKGNAPGIVGVNMDTGKADREILLGEKEPDYQVDEQTGRVFMIHDKKRKSLTAFQIR